MVPSILGYYFILDFTLIMFIYDSYQECIGGVWVWVAYRYRWRLGTVALRRGPHAYAYIHSDNDNTNRQLHSILYPAHGIRHTFMCSSAACNCNYLYNEHMYNRYTQTRARLLDADGHTLTVLKDYHSKNTTPTKIPPIFYL